MKWLAAIMIMCGSAGLGYSLLFEEKEKISLMQNQERLLGILQGEIAHFHRNLPDAFMKTAEKIPTPYNYFLKKVSERMMQWRGERLHEIWIEELRKIEKTYQISEKINEGLYKFVDSIDFEESEMQIKALEYIRQDMEKSIRERSNKLEQNKKWMIGVSTLLGILSVIIFF